MISYARRVGKWFSVPVIEHLHDDRPFRLRRVSAIMLAAGWATFAIACVTQSIAFQWTGGIAFVLGLASVWAFDFRDDRRKKPVRRRGM
jgi:hypothetical protein